jgi:hypothetical protein
MFTRIRPASFFLLGMLISLPAWAVLKKRFDGKAETTITGSAVLWRNPQDIATRNLFYGPGGEQHQPHGPFLFLKEDLDGSNPKFIVRDQDGVRWKVKLGTEARPETAASRLVWAVGYFADEDYFLADLRVDNMPPRLHRGQKLVASDGSIPGVRLKRYLEGEKKIGTWEWRRDPFTGTREFNGLRVMMALINNWDLKDENNAVYQEKSGEEGGPERVYLISDLGASFGTAGPNWPLKKAKGNLDSYGASKFIRRVNGDQVDFYEPSRPSYHYLVNPHQYFTRRGLLWIGKHIPRRDARWMGELLAQLSPNQIRDAFRAAGYAPDEVEGFAKVVQDRIANLTDL